MGDESKPKKRPRPIALEWKGGILEQPPSTGIVPVVIKGNSSEKGTPVSHQSVPPPEISVSAKPLASCEIRIAKEAKGRGGHPVATINLHQQQGPVKDWGPHHDVALLTFLKNHLGCGGTLVPHVDSTHSPTKKPLNKQLIILQCLDKNRLSQTFSSLGASKIVFNNL